jgi:hemerythrin-like domain-containing protein
MSQPVRFQSLGAAGPGFEQPFEMLEACHERVHRMLDLLARLRAHLRETGVDEQARQAARDVMRYFDQAAPQHHRDEELHVFPALLAQGDPRTAELVARLQQDHVQMEACWAAARSVLDALQRGDLTQLDAGQDAALDAFAGLYPDHIAAEEQLAYPAALAALDAGGLAAMSRDMMTRRGVR